MAEFIDTIHTKENDTKYSDGQAIEKEMLELAKKGNVDWYQDKRWPIVYHFSHLRHNILNWYPFKDDCSILEVGAGCGALTGLLCERGGHVTAVELTKIRAQINYERHKDWNNLEIVVGDFRKFESERRFDYIIVNGVLEYAAFMFPGSHPYEDFLKKAESLLAPGGIILLAIENRIGLKYLAGSREDHTGQWYSGINNYSQGESVRTFTKTELVSLIERSGLKACKAYYPYPDYKFPEEIFTDESVNRRTPEVGDFHLDQTWKNLFSVRSMNRTLMEEGIADRFANSFLMEIARDGQTQRLAQNIDYVKVSANRREPLRIATIIDYAHGCVKKIPLHASGWTHLENMAQRSGAGNGWMRNLACIRREEGIEFPFVENQTVLNHLEDLLESGEREEASAYLKTLSQKILDMGMTDKPGYGEEFEAVFGQMRLDVPLHWVDGGNIDLIVDNLFIDNPCLNVIDYEWTLNCPVPMEFVVWRMIHQLNHKLSAPVFDSVLEQLGITREMKNVFIQWELTFVEKYVGTHLMGKLSMPEYQEQSVSFMVKIKQKLRKITMLRKAYRAVKSVFIRT